MKFTVIIPASGRGARMGSNTPKQYLPLDGKPVLYYALKAFELSPVDEIILVVTAGEEQFVRENIVDFYGFKKVKKIVAGGAERYLSVKQGLLAAEDADYVLIHDAARPLIDANLIKASLTAVVEHGACVPAVPVADTIKVKNAEGLAVTTPDRSSLVAIQTPQCFERKLLAEAYAALEGRVEDCSRITDDASVVELGLGRSVHLVPGNSRNRKITTPEDLFFAEALLKNN